MRVILAIMLLALIGSASATKLTVATGKIWDLTYGTSTTTNVLVYTLAETQAAAYSLTTASGGAGYAGGTCFYTTSSTNLTFALNTSATYNAVAWEIKCSVTSGAACTTSSTNTFVYKMGATTGAKWVSDTALTLTGYADCTGVSGTPAISGNSISVTGTHTAACGPSHDSSWYGYCWHYTSAAATGLTASAISSGYSGITATSYISSTSTSTSTTSNSDIVNAAGLASIALVVSFF